jgi:hypothetical protein
MAYSLVTRQQAEQQAMMEVMIMASWSSIA